jgi:hypothetical protein
MCSQCRGRETGNRSEDLVGSFGPDKGLGILVVHHDELGDGGLQFPHAGMRTALNLPLREQRKPAFDLIEPRGMSGREV